MQSKRNAFTLAELLVAVVIVSIIGSFAAVTYINAYEKTRGHHAVALVRMIHAAEQAYALDWGVPATLTFPCTSNLLTEGYLQCPNTGGNELRAFNYTVGVSGLTFTITATRNGGRYNNATIVLTHTGGATPYSWSGSWNWIPN